MSGGVHHSGVGTEKFHVSREFAGQEADAVQRVGGWFWALAEDAREDVDDERDPAIGAQPKVASPTPSDLICEAFQEGLSEENVAGFVNAVVPCYTEEKEEGLEDKGARARTRNMTAESVCGPAIARRW
ncbi:hypothetical protein ZWY2020_034437 [Hordeum vulgare]|nr:hypothetical protein ZWY2020_034437 [Hordeum vulgare]